MRLKQRVKILLYRKLNCGDCVGSGCHVKELGSNSRLWYREVCSQFEPTEALLESLKNA